MTVPACKGLPEIRRARGLSQADTADLIAMNWITIYRWENGRTSPTIPLLFLLAQHLRVTPLDIMPTLALIPPPTPHHEKGHP